MAHVSKSRNYKLASPPKDQRGYMMITLMLALALITIALLTAIPNIKLQIQRDREEELRHRGTAYMRAVQHMYKKLGRFPTRFEDLENSNNIRFIRKRYKDPMTRDRKTGKEKDFKFLHQTDISLNNGPVLGQVPGQSGPTLGTQPGGSQLNGSASSPNASVAAGESNSTEASSDSSSDPDPNGPTFGGGPLLGVASTSKQKSIRVFYGKDHYNDWLFIYLQTQDRGGLLTGPVNPGASSLVPGGRGLPTSAPRQVEEEPATLPPGAVPNSGATPPNPFN